MPKIILLEDSDWGNNGDVLDRSDTWITFHARKIGEKFDLLPDNAKNEVKIANEGEMADAYSKLSEGDKDSVRKGFKKLVLRKIGWVLVDCSNKAMQEIHIMSIDRTVQIKSAKESAIARAASEVGVLKEFKSILRNAIAGEDCLVGCEDSNQALELVEKLTIGYAEVEVLKAEIDRLNKILKTR